MKKVIITFIISILSNCGYGQNTPTYIKLMVGGPRDVIVFPVVITTTPIDSFLDFIAPKEDYLTDDFGFRYIMRVSTVCVNADVYAFVENYFTNNQYNADESLLPCFERIYGTCFIYKNDNAGEHYYMIALQKEAIQYLEKFVKTLQTTNELKKEDISNLLDHLGFFINSAKK